MRLGSASHGASAKRSSSTSTRITFAASRYSMRRTITRRTSCCVLLFVVIFAASRKRSLGGAFTSAGYRAPLGSTASHAAPVRNAITLLRVNDLNVPAVARMYTPGLALGYLSILRLSYLLHGAQHLHASASGTPTASTSASTISKRNALIGVSSAVAVRIAFARRPADPS